MCTYQHMWQAGAKQIEILDNSMPGVAMELFPLALHFSMSEFPRWLSIAKAGAIPLPRRHWIDQKASPSFNQQKMGRVFSPFPRGSWRFSTLSPCYNLPRGLSLKNSVLRYLPENNKEYLYENALKPIKNLHRMNLCNTHFCSNWQGPVSNMRCLFLVARYVCTKRLDWYSYLLPVLRKV